MRRAAKRSEGEKELKAGAPGLLAGYLIEGLQALSQLAVLLRETDELHRLFAQTRGLVGMVVTRQRSSEFAQLVGDQPAVGGRQKPGVRPLFDIGRYRQEWNGPARDIMEQDGDVHGGFPLASWSAARGPFAKAQEDNRSNTSPVLGGEPYLHEAGGRTRNNGQSPSASAVPAAWPPTSPPAGSPPWS